MNDNLNPYESPDIPPESRRPKWLGFALVSVGCLMVGVLLWMVFGKFEIRR